MIDFRYHLVSLVAVFIALAVGIALGAGPLREGISDTLESEVSQLRTERADLRAQVDVAQQQAAAGDAAVAALGDRAVAGTLPGERVGVVVLPGADRNSLDAVEEYVRSAGGEVVLTVDLDRSWEDAGSVQERDALAAQLAPLVQAPAPSTGQDPTLGTVLAAVLAGRDAAEQAEGTLEAGRRLADAGYARFTWLDGDTRLAGSTERARPDQYLVLSGGLDSAAAADDKGSGPTRLRSRLELVAALGAVDLPAVVLGPGGTKVPTADHEPGDGLVGAVRADRRLRNLVSTVDDGETQSGRLAAVAALAWERAGEHGHFGLQTDADAPMPAPPPVLQGVLPGNSATSTAPVPDDAASTSGAP